MSTRIKERRDRAQDALLGGKGTETGKAKGKEKGKGRGTDRGLPRGTTSPGHAFPRYPLMVMLPKGARMRRRLPERKGQSMSPLARMKNRKWTRVPWSDGPKAPPVALQQMWYPAPKAPTVALHRRMQPGGTGATPVAGGTGTTWASRRKERRHDITSQPGEPAPAGRWITAGESDDVPWPPICTAAFGTVYCMRPSCGKLRCASRVFRHEAFTPCPCEPLQRGRMIYILDIGTIP